MNISEFSFKSAEFALFANAFVVVFYIFSMGIKTLTHCFKTSRLGVE